MTYHQIKQSPNRAVVTGGPPPSALILLLLVSNRLTSPVTCAGPASHKQWDLTPGWAAYDENLHGLSNVLYCTVLYCTRTCTLWSLVFWKMSLVTSQSGYAPNARRGEQRQRSFSGWKGREFFTTQHFCLLQETRVIFGGWGGCSEFTLCLSNDRNYPSNSNHASDSREVIN
jgi:hypothetical protein